MKVYMDKILKSLLLILFAFGVIQNGNSQSNNYIQLFDYSGEPNTNYITDLEIAADSLVAAFPTAYQDSFKVYDFGFYLHQEDYDGVSYPEEFEKVVRDLDSKYYLAFGRQTDGSGVNVKTWVEFKFDTENFLCLDEDNIRSICQSIVDNQLDNSNGSVFDTELAVLNQIVGPLEEGFCCSNYLGGSRDSRSSCTVVDAQKVAAAKAHLMSGGWPDFIDKIKKIVDWYNQCSSEEWESFHRDGIIPHCFWDGMVLDPLKYYGAKDIPFYAGAVDGTYAFILNGIEFVFSLDDLAQGVGQFTYQLTVGYLACGLDPRISTTDIGGFGIELELVEYYVVLEELYGDSTLWVSDSIYQDFKYLYETQNPWERVLNFFGVSYTFECNEVFNKQAAILAVYEALHNKDTYVQIWETIKNELISTWQNINGFSNEERYYHGYYAAQVGLSLIDPKKWVDFFKGGFGFLTSIKTKVTGNTIVKGDFRRTAGAALFENEIKKRSWYEGLDIIKKDKFAADFANDAEALHLIDKLELVKAWKALDDLGVDQAIRRNVTHLENVDGYFAKYPNRTSADLATTANQFDNVEAYLNVLPDITQNSLVKGTRFSHFSDPAITNYNGNFSHAEYSFSLWKNNKWDELEDFFTANNLNGGWPPNEGFKNVVNSETGTQLVGKKFDRFQGPGDISGGFASPVYSGEDIGDLFFTYDSRALKYDIAEGTQYILFEVKSSVPSGLKFDYGEVTPWFGKQGLGDQVKSSMRLEDVKDHLEIIDTKTYINGQWQ